MGSTSIQGAAAKPIIDIDIVLRSTTDLRSAIQALARIGYRHVGDLGIPGREAFENPLGVPSHHLYVVVMGNAAHIRHLRFRDYLRKHPEMIEQYSALKKSLAIKFRNDREAYTEAKTVFKTKYFDEPNTETNSREFCLISFYVSCNSSGKQHVSVCFFNQV